MSNLISRTITGVLFVACIVLGILGGPISFAAVFSIVTALTVWEFCQLANHHGGASVNAPLTTLGAIYLFAAFIFGASDFMSPAHAKALGAGYILIIILILVYELYARSQTPFQNWAYAFAAQIYIALPFSLLGSLAFHPAAGFETGYASLLPLSVFIFIWTNDTGAYCVGSLLHKRFPAKLFPRISPKKSWVGSIGGGLLCLLAAWIMATLTDTMTIAVWMGFAMTVCVFGTWGDLVESLLKRQLGIKDSGHILPGHGGMLDRFDSSLMAIPASTLYFYLIF